MNAYKEQRETQQRRINEYLHRFAFFAFSKEQLSKGLKRLQAEESDVIQIPGGGFMLKDRAEDFYKLLRTFRAERDNAIRNPKTGKAFARDMFVYELNNHEYTYTGSPEETLTALCYSLEDIEHDKTLSAALDEAEQILKERDKG